MRIAVISRTSGLVGGTEAYLDHLMPALVNSGHKVAFWCETHDSNIHRRIKLPDNVKFWSASQAGVAPAIKALEDWQPDLLYVHGVDDPAVEAQIQKIAPGIFFAHDYYGTCISGHKAFSLPIIRPCDRRFGPGCLVRYFPLRCGGLNPVTMMTRYRLQSRRLELLANYRVLLTHSERMRQEFELHGFDPRKITYYAAAAADHAARPQLITPPSVWRLLFLGRFDRLKGGQVLLDALRPAWEALRHPLHVTIAGDGPCRAAWQKLAAEVTQKCAGIAIHFPGWVPGNERDRLLADSHLLVVPSLWPEPFGRIGPEAGSTGLPVVAFDVGGMSDWLENGKNGVLASGRPPTAQGLAKAVIQALSDLSRYNYFCTEAPVLASRFTLANHLVELNEYFELAIRS